MYKYLQLLIILFFSALSSLSAQQKIQLHHVNTKGNVVKAIYSDANGIIWLGTSSGLFSLPQMLTRTPNTYHRPFTDVNISFNMLSGDQDGRLWIKNASNDMYRYDPHRNEFIKNTQSLLESLGVKVWKEFVVQADEEGNLWVIKDYLLHWLDTRTGKVTTFNVTSDDRILGIARHNSLVVLRTKSQLCFISLKDKKIIRSVALPYGYQNRRNLMIDDEDKVCIWADNHIRQYDFKTGEWSVAGLLPSHVTGVVRDDKKFTWVSTQSSGVFIYDQDGREVRHLSRETQNADNLQSDHVNIIYYDKHSHTVWMAYAKGGLTVCSTTPESFALENILDTSHQNTVTDVLTFAPTRSGRDMWVGLEKRGVFQIGQTVSHPVEQGNTTALYSAANGTLWAGFFLGGLQQISSQGVRTYFAGKSPYAIAEDERGKLFVGLLGEGVWWLNPETGDTANTHLQSKFVFDVKYNNHQFYAATTEGFYINLGAVWEKVCDGNFRYLIIDRYKYVWLLGNEGREGLTLLDAEGNPTNLFPELKFSPLKSIAIDDVGNVWIATPTELLMFQRTSGNPASIKSYSFIINPIERQVFYNYRAAEFTSDGILWLGTTTGYQRINTRKLIAQTKEKGKVSPLVMGSISINDKILSPGEEFNGRTLLSQDVIFTKSLDLKYNENNLVIECSYPFDNNLSSYAFYYQLKGSSDVWHLMEGRTIILSNLPPGDYELFTRTQFSQQSNLLSIHISPPFWQTWWAYLIYVLLAALAIWGVVRYYNNRRVYQQRLRELQLQQEQQGQMNEMKLRFFTNISHDLKTPLSLIIGPMEELAKQAKDPQQLSSLQMIHRNADHLLSLVDQILDFRRLEFGREKLVLSYGDIIAHLRDVSESFRLKANKEKILFSFLPAVDKMEIFFDKDKMTKIMMNLLSNAFKFTDAGGRIDVGVDIRESMIYVSVADTGIGIPDADKEHVFDRFFQSEAGNRSSMGSGIGLHVVREYVRLQGGDVTVSDLTEGKGTVFSFTIPLRKEEGNETVVVETHKGSEDEMEPVSLDANNPTVLVVEDNADMLTYIAQSLSSDYQVLTANSGAEALLQLKEHDVDVIVSDVMMPEMDGLELCRRVKTDLETSHIPVVLLTAKSMASDELQGLEAGADDYITKPFSMDILRQRIRNLVERNKHYHERFAKEIDIEPSEITVTSLDEQFIAQAIHVVEQHISEPEYSVEQMSEELGMHRAQLYKKLMHLTGKSPQQFMRILRLKRGRQLLEQSGLYISEVAYQVGFNSPRIFSKYFKEEFGITPKDFTNKTQQD